MGDVSRGSSSARAWEGDFPGLEETAWAKLDAFARLLRETAAPRGLVGFPPESIGREIARSLLLSRVIPQGAAVADVGSGAGLPGLPLLIARGRVTLVEPRQKAAAFLELAVRELDLEAQVVVGTADQAARAGLREAFGATVARQLAGLEEASRICSPLCSVPGCLVFTGKPGSSPAPGRWMEPLGLSGYRTQVLAAGGREESLRLESTVVMMDKVSPFRPAPGIQSRPRRAH